MSENDLQRSIASGFERSDTNARAVAWGSIILIVGALFMHWLVTAWFFHLKDQFVWREKTSPLPAATGNYRMSPASDEKARDVLNSYDWVDPKSGIVRIPIEKAIEKMSHEK